MICSLNTVCSAMYDPALGRFCSRDPIGYEGSKWDLYAYVDGMPTRFLDPSGLACQPEISDKKCCEDGDTFFNPGRSQGGTMCCLGRKVSCVWVLGGRTDVNDPDAKEIIDHCSFVHEDSHHQDVECNPDRPIDRPRPIIPLPATECHAFRAQIHCIEFFSRNCGSSNNCERELEEELIELGKLRDENCGNAGNPPPRSLPVWPQRVFPPSDGEPPSPEPR